MNKKQIIESLYSDKSFKKVCLNIATYELSEDLFHEIILIFLEMPEEKIIQAHKDGAIKWLFIRIASNNYNSKTSPFYKKYRHLDISQDYSNVIKTELKNNEFESTFEKLVKDIETDINLLDEYERELLKLYLKLGTWKKVSDEVGINYWSTKHAIVGAIKKIKEKNDKLYNDMLNERSEWVCNI